jgi:hypothetical protein
MPHLTPARPRENTYGDGPPCSSHAARQVAPSATSGPLRDTSFRAGGTEARFAELPAHHPLGFVLVERESVLLVFQECLFHHRLDVLGHLLVLWVWLKSVFGLKTDALGSQNDDRSHRPSILETRIVLQGRRLVLSLPSNVVA